MDNPEDVELERLLEEEGYTPDELLLAQRRPPVPTTHRYRRLVGAALVFLLLILALAFISFKRAAQPPFFVPSSPTRSKSSFVGFDHARLDTLPLDLHPSSSPLSETDLLSHPLLSSSVSPTCSDPLPPVQARRYKSLQPSFGARDSTLPRHETPQNNHTYLIAANLYNSEAVLPSLIKALHYVLVFMDPSRFHISIYENGSSDNTPLQLYLFSQLLNHIGVGYTIISDPAPGGFPPYARIPTLAKYRNILLEPLVNATDGAGGEAFDRVLFLNDVHICPADLLEILFQHEVQEADISCGMDWKTLKIPEFETNPDGYPLLFYDVWIARDILGLPFYKISDSGEWALPSPPLRLSPSRDAYDSLLPFQVFSCFNGVSLLPSNLFLPPHSIRFRSVSNTDIQSECYLLCTDIWSTLSPWLPNGALKEGGGRGAKIQVVPRCSVAYDEDDYELARKDQNLTSWSNERSKYREEEIISWEDRPPKSVVSYPYAQWGSGAYVPPF